MRILQVGLGRWGQKHLESWRKLGVPLSVCDANAALLEGVAEPSSTDFRELLAACDAVDVVTQAPAHAPLVRAALEAGKHVLVEKPFTSAASDGFALHAEARRRGVVLQVGHVFRFTPEAKAIREILARGTLGELRHAVARFASFKRPRADGGIAISDGIHFVDLLSWLFGRQPLAVTAATSDPLGRGLDDAAFLSLDYGGVRAIVEASCFSPEPRRDLEILGTAGVLRADLLAKSGRLEVYGHHHERDERGAWQAICGEVREVEIGHEEPLTSELAGFVEACRTGRASPVAADGFDGAAATAVLEAAERSAREGRCIALDFPARQPEARSQSKLRKVPLSRVEIDDEIRHRVIAAVDSGQYILGPECKALEKELAEWIGRKHCVLLANATAGLVLTMDALGIGAGDEVLVPAQTAFPTIEAIFRAGATPVFLDIDESHCLDPAWLEPRITARTKAIVPVHLYGHPCDLDAIGDVARRHGLLVLEDCAQAQGAEWREKRVGGFGVAGVFSFYPSKNLPTLGDGGAVVTDDAGLARKLRMLRDHGRREKFEHEIVGWNLRFGEIQAAATRVLLRRLDASNEGRRRVAARYDEALQGLPLGLPREGKLAKHVYHLYVVRTPERDALQRHLKERGIQTGIHYPVPNHLQPATLGRAGVRSEALPKTEAVCREILTLPCWGAMQDEDVDYVAEAIRSFFAGRS